MLLTLVVAILVQNKPAAPWEGVKENSWVTYRLSEGEKKTEEKRTLLRIEGTEGVIKVEPKEGEAKEIRAVLVSPPQPDKNQSIGSKYDLDGAKYDCGVVEGREVSGNAMGQAITKTKTWLSIASPIPGWFFRKESQTIVATIVVKRETIRLLHLNVKVRVEGISVSGWQTETTSEEEEQAGGTIKTQDTSWWSHEVPGWLVKQEKKVTKAGKTTTTKLEVAKFEVAK